jgi:hypothetical protein
VRVFTPLQEKVAASVAARKARGLPTGEVSFEFSSTEGSSLFELEKTRFAPGEGYAYTAKTTIRYGGPRDAGLAEWPSLALTPEQSRKLGLSSAELQTRYVAKVARANPGVWQRYKVGQEPRTYTIVETGRTIYPVLQPRPGLPAPAKSPSATSTASEDLVFGFSLTLPREERSTSFGIEDVEELKFTFVWGFGVGMRLPVAATISSLDPMVEGSSYSPTSAVHGLNFSAGDYAAVGLPAASGNEVYFNWQEQGCLEFSGVIDSGEQCAGPDVERHRDFTTPFGPGASVPFPEVDITVLDYGVAGIDLVINSSVGSNRITGDWSAIGAASGSGQLEYNAPSSPEVLSSVAAIDGPGHALVSVDGFLYHFTHFAVSPSLRVWVDVSIPIPLAPDIDWEDSRSLHLGTYELSDFIDHDFLGSDGASVGLDHNPGYSGPQRVTLDVPVVNVAPTAATSVAGGREVTFGGIATRMGDVGEIFTFTGRSHDPGRDDLTLSWSWGDGPPTPDVSSFHPLAASRGPNNAIDVRSHAFDRACLYEVVFQSTDDDAAVGADHASILVTQPGGSGGPEGFWQHQLERNGGGLLASSAVGCYLAIVDRVSTIFSERRSVATMEDALLVVNLAHNSGSEIEQLDRELLVAWLNFASGAIAYGQLVDVDGDGSGDTPFFELMQRAEAARLDPSSSAKELKYQTRLVHAAWSRALSA